MEENLVENNEEKHAIENPSFAFIDSADVQNKKPSLHKSDKIVSSEKFDIIAELNTFHADFFSSSSQTCIEINIEDDLEPLKSEDVKKLLKTCGQRQFVLYLRAQKNSSFAFYWRVKGTQRVFSLESETCGDLCGFIRDFLVKAVESDSTGLLPLFKCDAQSTLSHVNVLSLGDERSFNLLFLAVEAGNNKVVQSLLQNGFNASLLIDGKIPADVAYEKKHFDALLTLLSANSRFPRNFEAKEIPEDLNNFIKRSNDLRGYILLEDREKVEEILNNEKGLRHFYSTKNESVVTFTLNNSKFEIYEVLMSKNIFFGPREDLDHIMDRLNLTHKRKVRKIHLKNSKTITEKHLMILMSNSSVSGDDLEFNERFDHVLKAYKYLNDISIAKPVLKAVAARKDFEIHFDFNREFVRYLNPTSEPYTNGLFMMNGQILIGAKLLLDPEYEQEVYGVLIHEMCHLTMCLVYDNDGMPYAKKDSISESRFETVCERTVVNCEIEPTISSVFDDYPDEMVHPELIVRSPQLMALYGGKEEEIQRCRENFAELHDYFENTTIPDIEEAIPRIENEAKEAYEAALKKISTFKKIIWILVVLIAFGCPLLIWIVWQPTYTWYGLDPADQIKILNSTVKYRGLDVRLDQLIVNGSYAFEVLDSNQIKNALKGDFNDLNNAINKQLDQYIHFSPLNLTSEFWDEILKSDVNFQGQTVLLGNITRNYSSLFELSSDQIKRLLVNESIDIGSKIEFNWFYIPRNFVVGKEDSDDSDENPLNLTEVYEILEGERVFLLADSPGSGKSVVFQYMTMDLKRIHPDKWVEYVELKSSIDAFKNGETFDVTDLAKFVAKNISNLDGLESDLFIDSFLQGKVILLWDAVDEITPVYDEIFLTIAKKIFDETQNLQFISTRLQHKNALIHKFNQNFFSLAPYLKQDRQNFVEKFLKSQSLSEDDVAKTNTKVQTFIDEIIESESDPFKQDINNPLMLRMISEIAIDKELSKELSNIYEIYEVFVNMKLKVHDEKGQYIRILTHSLVKDISITEVHTYYALKFIFGNSYENKFVKKHVALTSLSISQHKITWNEAQIASYGFMSLKSSNQVDFVHRTFAEFFVARYLIKNIYEVSVRPRDEEMIYRIVLLHNVAFDVLIRKVIQDFILNFLKTGSSTINFPNYVIDAFKKDITTPEDYFSIGKSAPIFLKFFEKDERVMRILARVDKYEDINEWLEVELGISLGGKSSFIDNNQLGLILMHCWQFERKGNKVFADFIKKSSKVFDGKYLNDSRRDSEEDFMSLSQVFDVLQGDGHSGRIIDFSTLSTLNLTSEFLNYTSNLLTKAERREIFLNSLHIINDDLSDSNQSIYFINAFKNTLGKRDIVEATTRTDLRSETLFYKTLQIENFDLNSGILSLIEENFSNDEIFELFTKPDSFYNVSLCMIAARYQDYPFLTKFINFTRDHTTLDQFKWILLQRDAENDTILQFAQFFRYADSFLFLAKIYNKIIPREDIQKTYTERDRTKLSSVASIIPSVSTDVIEKVAKFMRFIFVGNEKDLFNDLARRDENGDTLFRIFAVEKALHNRIKPFVNILHNIGVLLKIPPQEIEKLFLRDMQRNI